MGECAQLVGAMGRASDADDAGVTHHVGQRRQIDERCAGVDRGEWVGVLDDPPGHLVDVPAVAAKIIGCHASLANEGGRSGARPLIGVLPEYRVSWYPTSPGCPAGAQLATASGVTERRPGGRPATRAQLECSRLSKFGAVALGLERTSRSDLADLVTGTAVLTPRLEVRLPKESDRTRFVELFSDKDFMVFSSGALSTAAAHDRFDEMLARGAELAFAKQPVIERSTGVIVGYAGVNWFDFEGRRRLEFGYRLVPEARGVGYATEASRAVVTKAAKPRSTDSCPMSGR